MKKTKEELKAYLKAYCSRPEYLAKERLRNASPERKAKRRAYNQTPGRKAKAKIYAKSPRAKRLQKARRLNVKIKTFIAYGGLFCCHCGDKNLENLTLDHINNNGNKHRISVMGKIQGGADFYTKLIKQGLPPGFQVLCMGCNWAKYTNGGLPKDKFNLCLYAKRGQDTKRMNNLAFAEHRLARGDDA